jgi:hypothetical protein
MADGKLSDAGRISAAQRLLHAVVGIGGVVAQFLITANPLMRGAMALGSGALLYMAVAGRVPVRKDG